MVAVIDIVAVIFHEIWNLYRKKEFYDCLEKSVDELDKKYLLPEMLPDPGCTIASISGSKKKIPV